MLTLTEACNILRVDAGNNDELIESLCAAIPGYIEVATGYPADQQELEPMCKTVSGFILTLWYFTDHANDLILQRTIDSMLKSITLKARLLQ